MADSGDGPAGREVVTRGEAWKLTDAAGGAPRPWAEADIAASGPSRFRDHPASRAEVKFGVHRFAPGTGVVLIPRTLPHPSSLVDEGRRALFTFIGVGIAVVVMFLASLLQKRAAKAVSQAPQGSPA